MHRRVPQQIAVGNPVRGNSLKYGTTDTGNGCWADCTKCRLHATRRRVVVRREGTTAGHHNNGRSIERRPRVLFIGESPGNLEDRTGEPFVGRSGVIFNQYLKHTHFQYNYCITNVVCCRPVDVVYLEDNHCQPLSQQVEGEDYFLDNWDRDPTPEEIKACKPHIVEIVYDYDPHCVVYLGKIAESYKTRLPSVAVQHPNEISRMEYKLAAVLQQARKIDGLLKQFIS